MIIRLLNGFLVLLAILIGIQCSQSPEKTIEANLKPLVDSATAMTKEYKAAEGGLGRTIVTSHVKLENAGCQWNSAQQILMIRYHDTSGYIQATPQILELPESWKMYRYLYLQYRNPNSFPVHIHTQIKGARNNLFATDTLGPSENQKVRIPLVDLPLTARNKNLYEPAFIRIQAEAKGHQEFTLELHELSLVQTADTTPEPVVDKFGQRIHGTWTNKVAHIEDLHDDRIKERKQLSNAAPDTTTNKYGGWQKKDSYTATGYFHLHRQGDQWWLIDPEGNPFWSLGVTGVRPFKSNANATLVQNKEYLFTELPSPNGTYKDVYIKNDRISFYYWNILRKYGELKNWRERIFHRFKVWGINTIGNWSSQGIIKNTYIPYTYALHTNHQTELRLTNSKLPDVFDPEWPSSVDSSFRHIRKFKEDSLLIGYFVDNEGGWEDMDLLVKADTNTHLRQKWLAIVKAQYSSLNEVNKAWESSFDDWKEVKNYQSDTLQTQAFREDIKTLESRFAETYFRTIRSTLQKYDPNHLYLGCRYTKSLKPPHILEKAGQFCDVITVNVYSLYPTKERMCKWYEYTGRPILIGEHHLPLKSQRQLPPHYQRFTHQERYTFYKQYVKKWAQMPFSLGCHWYQLVDQHPTGRPADGENQTVGLVDITDQPYDQLIQAIQESSRNIYKWHSKADTETCNP